MKTLIFTTKARVSCRSFCQRLRSLFKTSDQEPLHHTRGREDEEHVVNWSEDLDILVNDIEIHYENQILNARGFLKWSPKDGFQLVGSIYLRHGGRPTPYSPFRRRSIPRDRYGRLILRPNGYISATPRKTWFFHEPIFLVPGVDEVDLKIETLNFIQEWKPPKASDWHTSKVVFRVTPKILFPDVVKRITSLDGETINETYLTKGLKCNTENLTLRFISANSGYLECYSSLKKARWSEKEVWRIPMALETALAMCCGEYPVLIHSERSKWQRTFIEVRKEQATTSFHFLSPIEAEPLIDKEVFPYLFQAFLSDKKALEVTSKLCHQLKVAMQQETGEAMELLFSTALEGFVRRFQENPFVQGGKHLSLQNELGILRTRFHLPKVWNEIVPQVVAAQKRLRDRNAHPDWLTERDGYLTESKISQTRGDLLKLSRFYGFLVLAITGYPALNILIQTSLDKEFKPMRTSP